MRGALLAFLALLCGLPVHAGGPPANALAPDETADGWVSLFDGASLPRGLVIDGDCQIKDGVLVVGGPTQARLRFSSELGRQYDLSLELAAEGTAAGPVVEVTRTSLFSSSRMTTSVTQAKGPAAWQRLTVQRRSGADGGDGTFVVQAWELTANGPTGKSQVPAGDLSVLVFPGNTLQVRNIRVKTIEPETITSLLRLYAVLASTLFALVAVPLAGVWRLRRRRRRLSARRQ